MNWLFCAFDIDKQGIEICLNLKNMLEKYDGNVKRDIKVISLPSTNSNATELVKSLDIFPDWKQRAVLFINNPRYYVKNIFKDNPRFASFIMDAVEWRNNPIIAQDMLERSDYAFGYTETMDSSNNRISQTPVYVPFYFQEVERKKKPEFDIAFVSNRSMDIFRWCRNIGTKIAKEQYGIRGSTKPLIAVANKVEELYNRGFVISNRMQFEAIFRELCPKMNKIPNISDFIYYVAYFGINEAMYKQMVIQWLGMSKLKFCIAGYGWNENNHKIFTKYRNVGNYSVYGKITHDEELYKFYNNAKFGLQLNSTEGEHHSIREILSTGVPCIKRDTRNGLKKSDLIVNRGRFIHHHVNNLLDIFHRVEAGEELINYDWIDIKPMYSTFGTRKELEQIVRG